MSTVYYTGAFRFPIYDAAAARILQNAKLIKKCGYNVEIVSWGGEQRIEDLQYGGNFLYSGIEYIVTDDIDGKERNSIKCLFDYVIDGKKAYSYLKLKVCKNDIVILYNPSYSFTIRMLALSRKMGIRLISDITEWYDSIEIPGGKYLPFYWMNEWNMKYIQRLVDRKIVISSFLENYYEGEKTILLPPLVDIVDEKWTLNDNIALKPYLGVRLIFAGTIGKSKDLLSMVIKAVIHCINKGATLQLLIVGIANKDKRSVISIEDSKRYENHIIFQGRVDQTIVPQYYAVSDFSLFVRENNRKNMAGFPTKFAESMTSGVPVITNHTSDIHKYLQDGVNGFVVEDFNENELIKVLMKVNMLSEDSLDQMKRNAYQCAKEYFDYTCYVTHMEKFLVIDNK